MKSAWYYDYPIGPIGIAEDNGFITQIFFGNGKEKTPADYVVEKTPLIEKAAAQLKEYFDGKRTEFDLPLSLQGTEFQKSVWNALLTIPSGETRSYKDIAVQIGKPKATRAVGLANNRNPIAIVVPCHRVVGSDGSLTGYGGGLHAKQFLLDLEKRLARRESLIGLKEKLMESELDIQKGRTYSVEETVAAMRKAATETANARKQ